MENMTGLLGAQLISDILQASVVEKILSDERGLAAFRITVNAVKMSSIQQITPHKFSFLDLFLSPIILLLSGVTNCGDRGVKHGQVSSPDFLSN